MNENLPSIIAVLFTATTVLTLVMFFFTLKRSANPRVSARAGFIILVLALWLVLQGALSYLNFYSTHTRDLPPRFPLLIAPAVLTIIILFLLPSGRRFIDSLPLSTITWTNIVRIPVEFVLYGLFIMGEVPQLMTFAGRNFDILAGITAPFIAWYGFHKKTMKPGLILAWNIVCLVLLLNIVINAAFSAPFAFQQFAFDQPNVAVLHFPYSWLPGFIVPVVFFGHLVSIRRLW
jgi:hypothetical protein